MSEPKIDATKPHGARALERLQTERVAWMTTVADDGTPQSSPVWFIWDGHEFLIYSLESSRVRNIQNQPRASLNLDSNGLGGDIVVVEAAARIDTSAPSAADNPTYLAKYQAGIDGYGWTTEWFSDRYSVPIRLTPTKFRYW